VLEIKMSVIFFSENEFENIIYLKTIFHVGVRIYFLFKSCKNNFLGNF
jgi:hypothetical protein